MIIVNCYDIDHINNIIFTYLDDKHVMSYNQISNSCISM